MHRFTSAGLVVAGYLLAGIFLSSCNLYPHFGGWTLQLEIQSTTQLTGGGESRLISPDTRRVTVQLRKGGIVQSESSANLPLPGPEGVSSVSVEIPGVEEGFYEVEASAFNQDGQKIQVASAPLDFKPGARGSSLTLRLVPNEAVTDLVVPLGVGSPSAPVSLSQKTTGYIKLTVPESMSLWTDAPGFSLLFQKGDGTAGQKNLINLGRGTAQGGAVPQGTWWVYYFYDGLQPLPAFSYYVDTYDSRGNPVDRRPLLFALQSGGLLLAEVANESRRGPEAGKFPVDAALFQSELDALSSAIAASTPFLPPNYRIDDVAALAQAESALVEKTAALEAKRNGGPLEIPVTGISVSPDTLTLKVGETSVLTAAVAPSNATDQTVIWSSSDPLVAEVDVTGTVKANKAGTVVIKAVTKNGAFEDAAAVTVVVPVTGVSANPDTLTLKVGETGSLTAAVAPSNATDQTMIWSSTDPLVADVDASGKVTAKKAGKADIRVVTKDGAFQDVVPVTVVAPVTGVSVTPGSLTLKVGETGTLTAVVAPVDATDKTLVWSSSDPLVAEVDATGKVTAKKAGKTDIHVVTKDGAFTAKTAITVNPLTGGTEITIVPLNPGDPALGLIVKVNGALAAGSLTLTPADELSVTLVQDTKALVVLYWIADHSELPLPAPDEKVLVLTGSDFVPGPHELTVFYRTDPSDGKTYSLSLSFTVTE